MADKTTSDEGVNVQVLLRCRPLSDKEVAERVPQVITCNEALREVTLFQNTAGKSSSKTYRFDKVFGCDSTQEKLFKGAIVPIVHEVMDGFNCTIFAYGQTGTGKTYTMEGGPRESDDGRKLSAQAGVIPRSIKQIFDHIEASNTDSTVKVSFLELYNEELTDLLSFDDGDGKKLRLLEDRSGVVVQGLEEVIVRNATEIYQVLDRGTAKRRTAATLLNQRSSRSHSIFTITIHMKETTPDGEDVIKIGKLNLVDLAGSENISRSGAKDGRAREAGSINQSLLTLGRVITALVEHSGHVPYRDSKLTRLLRDSLGGRTKTCIIATIAPTGQCMDETISTLDYAHRAKNIRNRPELNQKISKTTMIKELAAEIEKLKLDLQCSREKNGVYLSSERYEQGELERVQLRESVKALRAEMEASETQQAAEMEALQTQHAAEVAALRRQLQARTEELSATRDELDTANITIQERVFVNAALRRAEQSLAVFAEKLTHELGLCSQDMQHLTDHLQEVQGLQSSDRQCLQQLQGLVSSRVQDLSDTLSATLSGQSQCLTAITQDVASFTAQKQQDVAKLKSKLTVLQTSVEALHKTTAQRWEAWGAATDDCYRQVDQQAAAYQQQAASASAAAVSAAEGALGALVQALQGEAQALEGLARAQAERSKEAERKIRELTDSAQSGLKSAATAASDLAQSCQTDRAAVQQLMDSFSASFETTMKQQQAQLLAQVAELVQGFTSSRSAALTEGLRSIDSAVAAQSKSGVDRATALATAAEQALTSVQELGSGLVSHVGQSLDTLQKTAGSCHAAVTAAGVAGASAQKALVQQLQHSAADACTHAQGVASVLKAAKQKGAAVLAESSQMLATSSQEMQRVQADIVGTVQAQHEESMVFAQALSQHAGSSSQALAGAESGLQEEVRQLSSDVCNTVSGALSFTVPPAPAERQRPPAPTISAIQDLICPPEEVVLAQLRNTKREIIRRGGDVRQAGALLLSPVHALAASATSAMSISPPSPRTATTARTMPDTPPSQQQPQQAAVNLRSRIPGAPSSKADAVTPVKNTLPAPRLPSGLVDRTNM